MRFTRSLRITGRPLWLCVSITWGALQIPRLRLPCSPSRRDLRAGSPGTRNLKAPPVIPAHNHDFEKMAQTGRTDGNQSLEDCGSRTGEQSLVPRHSCVPFGKPSSLLWDCSHQ